MRVNRDKDNINSQVQKNIEYKLENAKKVAESIGYDEILYKFLHSYNIEDKMTFAMQLQSIVDKMSITDKSLSAIYIYYGDNQELSYPVEASLPIPSIFLPKDRILNKTYDSGIGCANSQQSYIYYSCAIYDSDRNILVRGKRIGTVVVVFNSEAAFTENQIVCDYVITDIENNVVFSNFDKYKEGEMIDNYIFESPVNVKGTENMIYFLSSGSYWLYLGMRAGVFIILAIIISIILIAVNHVWLYKGLLKPINVLVDKIRKLKESNGSYLISESIADNVEIEEIVGAINFFIEENEKRNRDILEMKENMYKQESMTKAMEAEFLKQQIKPHFLYNTLGCVRSVAMHSGADVIADSITSLISILRYGTSFASVVTISEELDIIRNYIDLLNMRFNNKFRLNIKITPEIEKIKIAKLLIQPIIENCINHAYRDIESKANIDIRFEKDADRVNIIVRDYGCGIEPEKLKGVQDVLDEKMPVTDSVGMYNVNKRIKLIYGNDFGIFVSSKQGKGTCVEIKVIEMPQNRE